MKTLTNLRFLQNAENFVARLESVICSRNTLLNGISNLVKQSPCSGEVASVACPLFTKHCQSLWNFNSNSAVTLSICFICLGCSAAVSYCSRLSET